MAKVDYFFDGHRFRDYGVAVSGSKGMIGLPPRRRPNIFDYPGESGHVADLVNVVYDVRTIELTCYMVASSASEINTKWMSFTEMLNVAGIKTLTVTGGGFSLSFEVYVSDVSLIDKRWRDEKMHGTFTLRFVEPDTAIYE